MTWIGVALQTPSTNRVSHFLSVFKMSTLISPTIITGVAPSPWQCRSAWSWTSRCHTSVCLEIWGAVALNEGSLCDAHTHLLFVSNGTELEACSALCQPISHAHPYFWCMDAKNTWNPRHIQHRCKVRWSEHDVAHYLTWFQVSLSASGHESCYRFLYMEAVGMQWSCISSCTAVVIRASTIVFCNMNISIHCSLLNIC